ISARIAHSKKHGVALSDWSDCETKRLEMNHDAKMAISRAIEDDEGMADRSHPGGYRHILTRMADTSRSKDPIPRMNESSELGRVQVEGEDPRNESFRARPFLLPNLVAAFCSFNAPTRSLIDWREASTDYKVESRTRTIHPTLPRSMSCVPVTDDGDEACANCGKHGNDTIKLKKCTACRLVKYCGVDCQRAHRKQHKKACKQRAAELKDEELYSQGHERLEGDFCPICTLPVHIPIHEHSGFNTCCMKQICHGCNLAAQKRGMNDCAFCRTPLPKNDADGMAMVQSRVLKKDPAAILFLGEKYFLGELGLQKDMRRAVDLFAEAAKLGSVGALYHLGIAYYHGEGVQEDKAKGVQFFTKAAMQGHVGSRHNLGCLEGQKGNHDRAVRHFLISAKMGDGESVETIKQMFIDGEATKEQYAKALKGYHNTMEETKSHEREEAKSLRWK
ncbi:hypothetical protein THAOC_36821, partial [Thalassiosira oceanica]